MLTISLSRCSRAAILGSALVLAVTLIAPASVLGQEEPLAEDVFAAAPAEPSWDLTSGYGSVEASRAAIAYAPAGLTIQVPSDVRWAPAPAIAPAPSLSASRLLAARRIMQGGDLGSMQEEAMAAVIAEGLAWDATSGYGSVESSRAAIAYPAAPGAVSANSRMLTALRVLDAGDLGSMQEEALTAIVADGLAWDATSGYGSVEAGRAANAARAIAPAPSIGANPGDLAAAIAAGKRAESAHLATIPLYDDVPVNSDDRIANALFGPE